MSVSARFGCAFERGPVGGLVSVFDAVVVSKTASVEVEEASVEVEEGGTYGRAIVLGWGIAIPVKIFST